jgi:hypothetical protein
MIRAPDVAAGESEDLVQLLDLGPTVLELAGAVPADSMLGTSILGGGSEFAVVSSTFGAGPLRWAWQEGYDKVVLRMLAQPGLGVEARTKMEEGVPLDAGGFHFQLDADPHEDEPGTVAPELLERVGEAFAATTGQMVPGVQLVVWNQAGPLSLELGLEAGVVQAWSGAPMRVKSSNGRMLLECDNAFPLCSLALAGVEAADEIGVLEVAATPPTRLTPGIQLWRNPPRPLVVQGHEETLERLRALGYLK